MTRESIARELFLRNAGQYDPAPGAAESYWAADPDLRAFWHSQVDFVAARLGGVL